LDQVNRLQIVTCQVQGHRRKSQENGFSEATELTFSSETHRDCNLDSKSNSKKCRPDGTRNGHGMGSRLSKMSFRGDLFRLCFRATDGKMKKVLDRYIVDQPVGTCKEKTFMKVFCLPWNTWLEFLRDILKEYQLIAPLVRDGYADFGEITAANCDRIKYAGNTTTTPLKAFFFPIKENVIRNREKSKRVLLGVPNCDLAALELLDSIYLGGDFEDHFYKESRENTVIFGKDCDDIKDSCHCVSYGLNPYSEKNGDISMSYMEGCVYLSPMSAKGETFLAKFDLSPSEILEALPEQVVLNRDSIATQLNAQTKDVPDEKASRICIEKENHELWRKHASTCVSCGACSFICPTCHCFLLLDRKGFEKVKNWDACQLPGFSRVAAGEDPLAKLSERLKFRYLCKFSYKPDMFHALACTGCGRCIDACIGKINKNEVITQAFQQG